MIYAEKIPVKWIFSCNDVTRSADQIDRGDDDDKLKLKLKLTLKLKS